ncbi:MAG TPA: hypothetical protein VNA25_25930, partial [Phycisphaerae bacterium]|nr:hypothetical protein [Phycisphaerae bacterium]
IKGRHLIAAALMPKGTIISIKKIEPMLVEHSSFLRDRIDDSGINLVGPTVNHNVLQKFYTGRSGLWREPLAWVLRKGDRMAITRIGRAAYSEGKSLGLTGEALIRHTVRRTESIVRKSQPTWGAVYQSALARLAHSDWKALALTMFTSQTNKNYNMVRQAVWKAKNEGRGGFAAKQKARAKCLLVFANVIILNSIVMVGINEVRRWAFRGFRPRDEEDKWGPMDYAMDAVGQMTRIFYGGKVATDFLMALFQGFKRRFPSDPAEGMMDDAVRAAADMAQAAEQWYNDERYKDGAPKAPESAKRALKRSRRVWFTVFGIPSFPYDMIKGLLPKEDEAAPSAPQRRKWMKQRTSRRR